MYSFHRWGGGGGRRVTLSSCFYQTIRADDGGAGLSAPCHLQTMLFFLWTFFFSCQSLFISRILVFSPQRTRFPSFVSDSNISAPTAFPTRSRAIFIRSIFGRAYYSAAPWIRFSFHSARFSFCYWTPIKYIMICKYKHSRTIYTVVFCRERYIITFAVLHVACDHNIAIYVILCCTRNNRLQSKRSIVTPPPLRQWPSAECTCATRPIALII